jgi:hypothetical protein
MEFVRRIAAEHLVLGDQSSGAFGEEYFVAELDWCTHLAALDQARVRFEDRIDLIRRRHLFTIEHTAARLVDALGCEARTCSPP